ncbi:probable 26S proteasome regulatory subunit RPN8 [Saccharomycodes ludwigii]|uniref:Probable 26S proteasome regulatory subunit RPN8 n=1 Tax=Saccharomycodes ludwigii TaxID=36035 RepID=A0A376B0V1_9ASCO|nr:hypothetical protein SCDLUD_002196 [Saccharomycodes ludwigii]KAH3902376.1 hypothetical protein SCDLUD_002196 [Saccharomycodes ludwigii]SSD58316.1 probable 26S proteasome regulatory subunit RPN8 [Saccharomycodes ludwigii]
MNFALEDKSVTVAPLVLLSVLDHYERTNTKGHKRVLGVILGENNHNSNIVRVTNSFALPFEEDEKNSDVWFLDQNYIEQMMEMCKKINAKEKLIGWYHSGPKLRASDLKINNQIFKKYASQPVLLVVDVKQQGVGLPTNCYIAIEQIKDNGSSTEKTFIHLPSSVEAEEAEEIGVEHLLRDCRDQAAGGLSIKLTNQLKSLKGLQRKLHDIILYLNKVIEGNLPVNHAILGKLQDVFNLLPNLGSNEGDAVINGLATGTITNSDDTTTNNLRKALTIKTNDELMVIYISQLVRAIVSFDNLIENKIQNAKLNNKENKKENDKDTEEEKVDDVEEANKDSKKSDELEKSEQKK